MGAEERDVGIGEVRKPEEVVYLSGKQFRALTAMKAADEYHDPLPPSHTSPSDCSMSAPRMACSSGGSENSEEVLQRVSSYSGLSAETAESSSESLYMDCSEK